MSSFGKILVTGADGFIGSHVTELLIERGYDVRAFVFYNSFNSWGWLDRLPDEIRRDLDVFAGDIRDAHGVRAAAHDCDAILHLASLIGIPFSYHSPATYVDTNIIGTLNVVQAARDLGVRKVIQTSTSEVYGTARAVIPTIITQLLAGNETIRLGATEPTRDFNYVGDTAAAFLAMLEADGVDGETINIGSNFEISVGETARMIAEVVGRPLTIESDTQRLRPENSEVERLWADNGKAARLIGWSPEYGGLEGFRRGIQKTADWFADPANLMQYKHERYNI